MNKDIARNEEHSFSLKNRGLLTLCGVDEVVSFECECIVMKTKLGMLTVDGADMNVSRLDSEKGNVEIEGCINALYYMEGKEEKPSLFSRLFG